MAGAAQSRDQVGKIIGPNAEMMNRAAARAFWRLVVEMNSPSPIRMNTLRAPLNSPSNITVPPSMSRYQATLAPISLAKICAW